MCLLLFLLLVDAAQYCFHASALFGLQVNKASNSSNILDNLLSRMEQYANNLETLVSSYILMLVSVSWKKMQVMLAPPSLNGLVLQAKN